MEFDRQSISSVGSRQHTFERPGSDIKMTGYLKKLKTMKKKYFVLRCTSSSGPARLEYYDSEKKFKSGHLPKRSILLHTCFNINKKADSRHGKCGIALHTNEECLTVLTESDKELDTWLGMILEFQNEYLPDGDMHKEHYEHVWQVNLQPRGLGKGSKGLYRLCLNNTTVCLVKSNSIIPQFTIQLVTVRTVAHHESSFRLEVGNYAPTGAGEFWFTVEDANIAKDMHETLLHYMNAIVKDPSLRRDQQSVHLRSKRDSNSQAVTYCPASSLDASSPGSPNYPIEYPGGAHRLRSDSRTSRTSKTSFHDDGSPGYLSGFNGDHLEVMMREHCNVVPSDMSPPPSPSCLDDQISAYLAMNMDKSKQRSSLTSVTSSSTQSSTYLPMSMEAHVTSHKGDINTSHPDMPTTGYMPMVVHHATSSSHPIPIHNQTYQEPIHSSALPTVREGGSNEGYLPMDVPISPASSSGVPRPDPATCMLSDSTTDLPPRTYSLGSKPTKKFSSYMEMGPKKGTGNDISRATSAPHILKGRRDRDHRTESPTPSASPLSMSLKSDDSGSFMEYMPMRPRTASDSFNYHNRTSGFGKVQQNCRPRSSSHGQGTRPIINFSKLSVEKARTSQEPLQKTSRESSLQGSFDSLRVSSESLRRMSQEMRQTSGSNASDYAEMRGTPSPQMKNMKSEPDGYVSMQMGTGVRRSSPHRVRTDSSGSGRSADVKSNSSDRLHQQSHLQQITDYTEMAPQNYGNHGDSYMNMDYNVHHSISGDTKSSPSTSMMLSSHQEDTGYMKMDLDASSKKSDGNRSLSMENVDSYVMFDPLSGNKPRTGSLGSKDKTISRPSSARKSSSASVSSASSPRSSGIIHQQSQPSVSASTRMGGSSDSIKKTSRLSSTDKFGSLGKDFRKKSASTGSRPSTGKTSFSMNLGKDQHQHVPARRPSSSKLPRDDVGDDEYIEFSPTATKGDNHHHHHGHSNISHTHSAMSHSNMPLSNSGRNGSSVSSGSYSSTRSNPTPSPAEEEAYTLYSPAASSSAKSVHFQQQEQHSHHNPPQTKIGPSPSSAHLKQATTRDTQEYVGFEPGTRPNSSYFPQTSFSNVKQVEAKETPQYVGFEPGIRPSSIAHTPLPLPKLASPNSQEEYVGFEPGIVSQLYKPSTPNPITPNSAISYIQGSDSSGQFGLNKPKQHHMPIETAPKHNRHSANMNPQFPTSLIFNPPGQPVGLGSVSPSQTPPVPPLPLPASSSQQSHSVAKPAVQDTNEYLKYNPAEPSGSKASKENLGKAQDKADGFTLATSAKPQLTQLFIDVGDESKSSPAAFKSPNIGNSPREQNKPNFLQQQQKLQQPPHNFYRQLSAPASQSPLSKPTSSIVESQIRPLSPQPFLPENFTGFRQKHLSSSSVLESPSPTGSGSRYKHWSGSSNSSKKSRKASSDSERSFRKGNKPDSSGGNSRHRFPSGKKSPEGFLEESLGSHKNNELSSGISSLEAKIIPTEAKIRHSLGDVTSIATKAGKDCQDHHGLVRPDSTPCIQNLASSLDPGSRSVGDTPNSTPRSGSVLFSVGPRSRHSLSDLGAYQQMNFPSSGIGPNCHESSNSMSNKVSGSNSGINESNSSDLTYKPLNYVKLDLGCLEGQGDTDGKSAKVKSRNSSDTDARPPPLSYAEIDFVKSQGWNKAQTIGISGESSSSKS